MKKTSLFKKQEEHILRPLKDVFGIGRGLSDMVFPISSVNWQPDIFQIAVTDAFREDLVKSNEDQFTEAVFTIKLPKSSRARLRLQAYHGYDKPQGVVSDVTLETYEDSLTMEQFLYLLEKMGAVAKSIKNRQSYLLHDYLKEDPLKYLKESPQQYKNLQTDVPEPCRQSRSGLGFFFPQFQDWYGKGDAEKLKEDLRRVFRDVHGTPTPYDKLLGLAGKVDESILKELKPEKDGYDLLLKITLFTTKCTLDDFQRLLRMRPFRGESELVPETRGSFRREHISHVMHMFMSHYLPLMNPDVTAEDLESDEGELVLKAMKGETITWEDIIYLTFKAYAYNWPRRRERR